MIYICISVFYELIQLTIEAFTSSYVQFIVILGEYPHGVISSTTTFG